MEFSNHLWFLWHMLLSGCDCEAIHNIHARDLTLWFVLFITDFPGALFCCSKMYNKWLWRMTCTYETHTYSHTSAVWLFHPVCLNKSVSSLKPEMALPSYCWLCFTLRETREGPHDWLSEHACGWLCMWTKCVCVCKWMSNLWFSAWFISLSIHHYL